MYEIENMYIKKYFDDSARVEKVKHENGSPSINFVIANYFHNFECYVTINRIYLHLMTLKENSLIKAEQQLNYLLRIFQ